MTPNDGSPDTRLQRLHGEVTSDLMARHGPMLSGTALAHALGHTSAAALRQARRRGPLAVAVFTLPKRRGYFALTSEVAAWIARARLAADGLALKEDAPEKLTTEEGGRAG